MAEFAIGRGRSIRFVITPEPTATATNPASNRVTFGPEREVRFAVVMYGGVSLAIYINGVAQELLNLVRATAPKTADPDEEEALLTEKELTGAGKIYRRLGQYLYGDRNKLGESQYYHDEFRVDRGLEQRTALQLISRATNVTGNMFEGLAAKYRFTLGKRIAALIAWLGAVFWNILGVMFTVIAAIRKVFGGTEKKIRPQQ